MSAIERIITRSRSLQLEKASQLAEDARYRLVFTNESSTNITSSTSSSPRESDSINQPSESQHNVLYENGNSMNSSNSFHGFPPNATHSNPFLNLLDMVDTKQILDSLDSKINSLSILQDTVTQLSDRLKVLEADQSRRDSGGFADFNKRLNALELKSSQALDIRQQLDNMEENVSKAISSDFSKLSNNVAKIQSSLNKFVEDHDRLSESQTTFQKEYTSFQASVNNSISILVTDVGEIVQAVSKYGNIDSTKSHSNTSTHVDSSRSCSPSELNTNSNDLVDNISQASGHVEGIVIQEGSGRSNSSGNDPLSLGRTDLSSCEIPSRNRNSNPFLVDGNSNINSSTGNRSRHTSNVSTALEFKQKLLKTQMTGLRRQLSPDPRDSLTRAAIIDIYKNRLLIVDSEKQELGKAVRDYLGSPSYDNALCEEATDLLEDAANWISEMRELYYSQGYYLTSQSSKFYEKLPKYSQDCELGIFEFLRRFEAYTSEFDIESEKAELLHSQFLVSEIKEEMVKYKDCYEDLKSALLHRYGDLKVITHNMLLPVVILEKPCTSSGVQKNLNYYRKFQYAMQNINKLLKSSQVPTQEVESYLYSHEFLSCLISLIPLEAKNEFIKMMLQMDEDTVRIKGKIPFKLVLTTINQYHDIYDASSRTEGVKPKSSKDAFVLQSHHGGGSDNQHESDRELTVGSVYFQNTEMKGAKPDSPLMTNRKFPCMLSGHDHELGGCEDFFNFSPQERVEACKSFGHSYCRLCLQSNDICTPLMCSNIDSIPTILVCRDCKKISKKNRNRPVFSIFFCFSGKHKKPEIEQVIAALKDYIPSMVSLKSIIKFAASSNQTRDQQPGHRYTGFKKPVVLNTTTGCHEDPPDIDLVNEVGEDSIAVMQVLNLNGRHVLTLFDRGSNQHLIKKKIAKEIGIMSKVVKPSTIRVLSGDYKETDSSQYDMFLGPTPEGKYHEIVSHSMKTLTSKYPLYELEDINRELLEHADISEDTILPKYVGGDEVGLLIGLKHSALEPVCVLTLPSGVGVYRSPFRDVFGSYYCYGGPNTAFSLVNKKVQGNGNCFQAYMSHMVNQYKNSIYSSSAIGNTASALDSADESVRHD